jgi:hypothetical protein
MFVLDRTKAVLVYLPCTERASFVLGATAVLAIKEIVVDIALVKSPFDFFRKYWLKVFVHLVLADASFFGDPGSELV